MQLEILVGWKKLKIAIENSCSYLQISAFGADRWKLFNWLEIDAVTFKIFQLAGNSCSSTLKLQLALHSFARVLAFIKTGFGVTEGECGEAVAMDKVQGCEFHHFEIDNVPAPHSYASLSDYQRK